MKACIIGIFALFAVFFGTVTVLACECRERRGVRDEISASEHVVMAVLELIEDDRASLTVVINYKGNLTRGDKVVFEQSKGKDCRWRFGGEDIAKLYLFYLPKRSEDGAWEASTCSRSALVKDAIEDLKYIDPQKEKFLKLPRLKDDWRPIMDPRVGSLSSLSLLSSLSSLSSLSLLREGPPLNCRWL